MRDGSSPSPPQKMDKKFENIRIGEQANGNNDKTPAQVATKMPFYRSICPFYRLNSPNL